MGFLEGLGRSRAITGTLSAIDQLKANEQNRAINEQNLRMNEMDLIQQQRKFQYEQQQLDAQAAEDAKMVNVNYSPFMLSLEPETRELIKQGALAEGVIDKEGWAIKGKWKSHVGELEKTEDQLKAISSVQLRAQKNKLDQALQEQYDLEEKGNADPNKLALMQKKVAMLREKYLFGANKAKEAIELLKGQGQEKPKTMNQWQLLLDAAGGDPKKAIEMYNAMKAKQVKASTEYAPKEVRMVLTDRAGKIIDEDYVDIRRNKSKYNSLVKKGYRSVTGLDQLLGETGPKQMIRGMGVPQKNITADDLFNVDVE